MLQSLETEISRKEDKTIVTLPIGTKVSFRYPNTEEIVFGRVIKNYSDGDLAVMSSDDTIIISPEDLVYVGYWYDDEFGKPEAFDSLLIDLMESIMPLENWLLSCIGLSVLIFLIQQLI